MRSVVPTTSGPRFLAYDRTLQALRIVRAPLARIRGAIRSLADPLTRAASSVLLNLGEGAERRGHRGRQRRRGAQRARCRGGARLRRGGRGRGGAGSLRPGRQDPPRDHAVTGSVRDRDRGRDRDRDRDRDRVSDESSRDESASRGALTGPPTRARAEVLAWLAAELAPGKGVYRAARARPQNVSNRRRARSGEGARGGPVGGWGGVRASLEAPWWHRRARS